MSVLFLDFFGTLVDYSPSRTNQGLRRCHELVRSLGSTVSYPDFLTAVDGCFADFDRRSDRDDREFSMTAVAAALLDSLGVAAGAVAELERIYVAEWSAGVVVPSGLVTLLSALRSSHRLAVVSNTHSPTMVPDLLASIGAEDLFEAVVLSVDVGWRKPHPRIYAAALSRLGAEPADAVFVGDSYRADYVGPREAGMRALLIDPLGAAPIPAAGRIESLYALPEVL